MIEGIVFLSWSMILVSDGGVSIIRIDRKRQSGFRAFVSMIDKVRFVRAPNVSGVSVALERDQGVCTFHRRAIFRRKCRDWRRFASTAVPLPVAEKFVIVPNSAAVVVVGII